MQSPYIFELMNFSIMKNPKCITHIILALTLLCIPALGTCCLNCASYSGSNCGVCSSNYYLYNSLICLGSCPSGYSSTLSSCVSSSSLVLIDINFSQYSDWSVSTVDTLTTSDGNSLISSSTNLIPTRYQGFYMQPGAYLLGTSNWVPSPDLTMSIWVLILADGHIFEMGITASTVIKFYISASTYNLAVFLLSQSTGVSTINTYPAFTCTYAWELMEFNIVQTSSSVVTMKISQNGVTDSSSFTGYEARYSSPYNWSLGCRFGFSAQGYVYHLRVYNGVDSTVLSYVSPPICGFNHYWNGFNCYACSASCTTWPWCISGTTCSPCYSTSCASCNGFSQSQCLCTNGAVYPNCCQPGCSSCTDFWVCGSCDSGYYTLGSICLNYCASGSCTSLTANSLIDEVFDTFLGDYSGFVTGSNANTFYPFNSPDTDDPVPIYERGLYFTPATSLNNPNLLLAYTFTLGVWTLPTSGNIFMKGSEIKLASDGTYTVQLFDETETASLRSTSSTTINGWSFIAITVEFTTDTTSITTTINNSQYFSNSYLNYIFKDMSQSSLIIGDAFTGFVYGIKLWNYAVSSFTTEVNNEVCGTGLGLACLLQCTYSEYFAGSCQACPSSCSSGCVRDTSCDVCADDLCLLCSSFTSSCTSCPSGTMLISGACCQSGCSSCSTYWTCNSCSAGYYNLANICLSYCASGSCTSLTSSALIDVVFDTFLGEYSGFVTGANANTYYPFNNPDTDDPIPIYNRGLYFTAATSLNNPSVLVAYTFSIGVWVLPTSGYVFSKGSSISLGSDGTFTLQLLDRTGVPLSVSSSATGITVWSFITITTEFITDTTTITTTIANTQYFSMSYLNYIFQDINPTTLQIGDAFTGFVYGFKFWNSAVSSFSYEYNDEICGTGLQFACLFLCSYDQYYYDLSCMTCKVSCTAGCVRGSSCNLCNADSCLLCGSFTGPCTSCSGGGIILNGVCESCYLGCSTCTSGTYNSCTSCIQGYYLWEASVCLNQCPTGYTADTSCNFQQNIALDIIFDEPVIGSQDKTTYGSVSSNIYPDFDANDPWPAVDRGYYFNAGSYISSSVILAPTFTINTWLKVSSMGEFLSKSGVLSVLISATSTLQLTLVSSTYSSSLQIPSSIWCFLTISVSSLLSKIYLNMSQQSSSSLPSLFFDPSPLVLYISNSHSSFEGFVYSLDLYNQADLFGSYFNSTCPLVSFCLSACNFNEDPANNCAVCPSECSYGCFEGSCNLCDDQVCYHCNFYDTCLSCRKNSSFQNLKCTCNDGYFWNSTSESCQSCEENCTICSETECLSCIYMYYPIYTQCYACPEKCLSCDDPCTQCIPNASFTSWVCTCDLNYNGVNCSSVILVVATATVDGPNITLVFSDPLSADLTASSIVVEFPDITFTWVVSKVLETEYIIALSSSSEYPSSNGTLNFTGGIISVNNAELVNKSLIISLSESSNYQSATTASVFSAAYSKTSSYAVAGFGAISALHSNPTALWSFINTIQLLCFIPLSNVDLPPEIQGTLVGLRSYNVFPNIFQRFYHGGNTPNNTRAVALGFVSDSVILNAGKEVTSFGIFLCYYFVFYLLSFITCRIEFIRDFVKETVMEFKYGFFLRFAIQYYLEFCVTCLLAINSAAFANTDEIINFALAVLLTVRNI